jgi:hypothetical protein
MRLAWDDRGLLVLVWVHADKWHENPQRGGFWQGDDVELFLSPRQGDPNVVQWVIAPGMDKSGASLQWELYDNRKDDALKKLPTELEAARTRRVRCRGPHPLDRPGRQARRGAGGRLPALGPPKTGGAGGGLLCGMVPRIVLFRVSGQPASRPPGRKAQRTPMGPLHHRV